MKTNLGGLVQPQVRRLGGDVAIPNPGPGAGPRHTGRWPQAWGLLYGLHDDDTTSSVMFVTQRSATHNVGPRLLQLATTRNPRAVKWRTSNAAATPILGCVAAPHGKALQNTPARLPSTATHPGCLPTGTHDCGTAGCATTTTPTPGLTSLKGGQLGPRSAEYTGDRFGR